MIEDVEDIGARAGVDINELVTGIVVVGWLVGISVTNDMPPLVGEVSTVSFVGLVVGGSAVGIAGVIVDSIVEVEEISLGEITISLGAAVAQIEKGS
jgi:hypothetical protein